MRDTAVGEKAAFRLLGYLLMVMMISSTTFILTEGGSGQTPISVGRGDPLPSSFDLREFNGSNFVSSVKSQSGGTCWTHGVMASMESNLLMTGEWERAGEEGEPNLAEYHLDWWNGFNTYNNDDKDPPAGGGLTPHYGGDYLVATAYLSRLEGAVRDIDGQSFSSPPERWNSSYHHYYPMEVAWLSADQSASSKDLIKESLLEHGAVGTCICWDGSFMNYNGFTFYQPSSSPLLPNHAVTIIGWNDTIATQAPEPGAWLVKNSWGKGWGMAGYFWVSFHDKYAGKEPEMGAVSFRNVSYMPFAKVYSHDNHGWRDELTNSTDAFNSFNATADEQLRAVSFYTTVPSVDYEVWIYDGFENGTLTGELGHVQGRAEQAGFHTVILDRPVDLHLGDDFHIHINLSDGDLAYDRTSQVPVLLGPTRADTWVVSRSSPNQSFYIENGIWKDLFFVNQTSNFCIKGLVGQLSITRPMRYDYIGGDFVVKGTASHIVQNISVSMDDGPFKKAVGVQNWLFRFDGASIPNGLHRITARGYNGTMAFDTSTEVYVDNSPPVMEVVLVGAKGRDGWFLGEVRVALEAEDPLSGVSSLYYSLDGAPFEEYSSEIVVAENGNHTVLFYGIDRADNAGEVGSVDFRIDSDPPVASAVLSGKRGGDGWYITTPVLTLQSMDNTSGPDSISLSTNGGGWEVYNGPITFSRTGSYVVDYRSEDHAGNQGPLEQVSFDVDIDTPSSSLLLDGRSGENGWFISNVSISVQTVENGSGIAEVSYRFQGYDWEEYIDPLILRTDGVYGLEASCADVAGNFFLLSQQEIKLDRTAPETRIVLDGRMGKAGWYVSAVNLTFEGKDSTSGLNKILCRMDGGPWTAINGRYSIPMDGEHLVEYRSVDNAGNSEQVIGLEMAIDSTPPVITLGPPFEGDEVGSPNVTLEMDIKDVSSGIGTVEISLDDGPFMAISPDGPVQLSNLTDGEHSLVARATDAAGNTELKSVHFRVNLTGPDDDNPGIPDDDVDLPNGTADGDHTGLWVAISLSIILLIIVMVVLVAYTLQKRRTASLRRERWSTQGSGAPNDKDPAVKDITLVQAPIR